MTNEELNKELKLLLTAIVATNTAIIHIIENKLMSVEEVKSTKNSLSDESVAYATSNIKEESTITLDILHTLATKILQKFQGDPKQLKEIKDKFLLLIRQNGDPAGNSLQHIDPNKYEAVFNAMKEMGV